VVDNVAVTNRALAQIGTHSQIASMVDGSEEARYANLLYNPLRDFMLAEGDYDFSLQRTAAVFIGSVALPWVSSYQYPSGALRIRSVIPVSVDLFNPTPIEFNIFSIGSTRIIITTVAIASVVYTYAPVEDIWDPIFTEAYTRLLASALAFALENRIEASKEKLTEALNFAGIANLRDV
jgi:hypothetical protein